MSTTIVRRPANNSPGAWDAAYGPEGWHDADYCDAGACRLEHRHDRNCRCADCFAADEAA
jgi:hypothetical protein